MFKPKPVINAQEALEMLRMGKTDKDIMARFNLSSKGLQSLYSKLIRVGALNQDDLDSRFPERQGFVTIAQELEIMTLRPSKITAKMEASNRAPIRAVEAVRDIRSGMTDTDLMDKYKLSAKGLRNLYDQLVSGDLITWSEIDDRFSGIDETVDLLEIIKKLGLDRTVQGRTKTPEVPLYCIACGAPQSMEFEECPHCGVNTKEFRAKKAIEEKLAEAAWVCPACGKPQNSVYDECPICGVVVAKIKK